MNKSENNPYFEAMKLAAEKAKDYQAGVSRSDYFPHGLYSYSTMVMIKAQRIKSLVASDVSPANESLRDSLLDLINYAAFTISHIDSSENE